MLDKTYVNTSSILFLLSNKGSKDLTIYSEGAYLIDSEYSSYNRPLTLIDYSAVKEEGKIVRLSSGVLEAGKTVYIAFIVDGSKTWYDRKTTIKFYFKYDGVKYVCYASSYYGTQVYKV